MATHPNARLCNTLLNYLPLLSHLRDSVVHEVGVRHRILVQKVLAGSDRLPRGHRARWAACRQLQWVDNCVEVRLHEECRGIPLNTAACQNLQNQ